MKPTAYDSILEYSSVKQFGDFRRILIGNRGTISSGKLVKGLSLVFDKNDTSQNESLFSDAESQKVPINIVQKMGSRGTPGLIFNRNGYDEVLRQVESRGEISVATLMNKLAFEKAVDESIWEKSSETVKRRCVSRNLDKLLKETQVQYRVHGDRMHYLTIGAVEVRPFGGGSVERYPLFLFSCPELDLNKMRAEVETTGFINFWLDKNIFNNEIGQKLDNNFEVTLDSGFSNEVNTISQYMNAINLSAKYESVEIDPSYMAFQIVTGFEAEYVDPAWKAMLGGDNNAN